ncbi:MAG: glycosyl transferase [Gammaproteobacteria bacterium]|nr:MAG: glycosyl transferase [Gammaproteobacteria bacterium]
MSSLYRPCIVVPFYNHGQFAHKLINELAVYQLPVIIVDDGSQKEHRQQLEAAIRNKDAVSLTTLKHNQGKGKAVITGFKLAQQAGYTHVIQIDADCQHDFSVLPDFLKISNQHPNALICGYPHYNETVPRSRLYPRYITHFWVCINTLSTAIKDSMCGFRCYPLSATLTTIDQCHIGLRMDFDIEIVVRLYWQGLPIINLPVAVIYHQDASSHFRLWRDNILISRTHAVLFFGMTKRLPTLLMRKWWRV